MTIRNLRHVFFLLVVILLSAAEHLDRAYREEIQKWREAYDASLKKDNGWLAVAGLFWLKEGDNSFGTGAGNGIVLPAGSAPEIAGAFIFRDGRVRLRLKGGVHALVNGDPLRTRVQGALAWLLAEPAEIPLKADTSGKPDRITLGRLSMILIQRGARYGIRLWDNASPARRDFRGTQWFPVDGAYRVTAQFVSYPQPKMIAILNILGDTKPSPSPGYAAFEIAGQRCRLEPILEDKGLFFIFKDRTSSKQTYPAGRFLHSGLPQDGKLILDFNRATNPPCAFTAYATCPLPPRQNDLPVAIDAGELNYGHAKP